LSEQYKRFDAVLGMLLTLSIFIHSLSFLSIKISTLQTGGWAIAFLAAAFLFMGLRALLWQKLLQRADLSTLYPFTALVQVLILLYAVAMFNEEVTTGHLLGLLLMLAGAYVIATE
jgi:drug/metabolite transporter (DMT)-like permease